VLALDPVAGQKTLELVKQIVRASDTLHMPLAGVRKPEHVDPFRIRI
jgi:hypothetical protein